MKKFFEKIFSPTEKFLIIRFFFSNFDSTKIKKAGGGRLERGYRVKNLT